MTQKLRCGRNNIKVTKDGIVSCTADICCPKSPVNGKKYDMSEITETSYCFRPDCLKSFGE